MAKEKKHSPEPPKTPNSTKKEEPIVSSSSTTDPIMGFYFRSVLLGALFFGLAWYVIVYNYHDMAEAEKFAKRIQAQDPSVTSEEREEFREAQKYSNSFDYLWLHNYKWVYHNLLNKNLQVQYKVDTFDYSERQAYKNGVDYQYIKIILDKTPPNAVILMPDAGDVELPKDAPANVPRFNMITQKAWCYYFLYPRTLVYDEIDGQDSIAGEFNFRRDPSYAEKRKKVTHVAIVFGKGYEHLNYQPENPEPHTVLPINKN